MTAEEALQRLIETLIKRIPVSVSVGMVKAVDKDKHTCTVEREERPTLFKVRLNSVISDYTDHYTVFPKIGSFVLCVVIGEQTDCFLLALSEPEEISIKIGQSEFLGNKDGWFFNGGENKGVVNISALESWMKNVYQDMMTISTGLASVPYTFTPTTKLPDSDLEDKKVKH